LQPFFNYNLRKGWYLTSSPLITANWEAKDDNRWTVPIGGSIGRIFKIGDQAINANIAAYYNVVTPDDTGANVHDEDKAAFERLCLGVQIEQEGVGVSGVPVD